ncbi:MAG: thioredoxin family protein [Methylacidiphilales bacterium]|nr:thioredoxin family protein [Candidatus Methylacidiphilales bacterium]
MKRGLQRFNGNKDGLVRIPGYSFGMIRALLLFLAAGILALRASDPIAVSYSGASAKVQQPHVTAELIPQSSLVTAGKPFDVILHLHSDPGWHTYWINYGDAGLSTTIKWTLSPGFNAGPIQWPVPEIHKMGPLVTYGYEGDVYLITTITPPKTDLSQHVELKARASWLACREECIPGRADLSVGIFLYNGRDPLGMPVIDNSALFEAARARLPVENTLWDVSGDYTVTAETTGRPGSGRPIFEMGFESKGTPSPSNLANIYFFPEQTNVFSPKNPELHEGTLKRQVFLLVLDLIQNGERPDRLSGVLVSDNALIGSAKAVHISNITVLNGTRVLSIAVAGSATVSSSDNNSVARRSTATTEPPPFLIAVLAAAFVGGLILNLMPCVLPVLSLKVFSLIKHAGENQGAAWKQGAAFTMGVVLSVWLLAGLLLALRAAGNHLGWGFQMQSPGFVLAMIFLFFLLGLNLFGVFEIGTSLVGLDAKATGRLHGLASSFFNGALATLAATPCTAPFMGSSLGFAAQQPPFVAMLIFTFLALGMAVPYLLLTIFPGALRFVPKPGPWMETVRQFMGFLLMASVIWLVYVYGMLTGPEQMPFLLGHLLVWALIGWLYGRGAHGWLVLVLVLYVVAMANGFTLPLRDVQEKKAMQASEDGWQNWSPAAVDAALDQGRPVFVDFTAAWCLSCKVNERVALDTDAVKKAFADKNVLLFRADWTHSDPEISKALQQYNRDGVPLYLLYSPKQKSAPQVLPEVLTPGIVLDALQRL